MTLSDRAAITRETLSFKSFLSMSAPLIESVPSFFTVKTALLFSSGGAAVFSCFGSCSQNCFASSGVTTMKMISSTRTTSTSGVTFISGVARPFLDLPALMAIPMVVAASSVLHGGGGAVLGRRLVRAAAALLDLLRHPVEPCVLDEREDVAHFGVVE